MCQAALINTTFNQKYIFKVYYVVWCFRLSFAHQYSETIVTFVASLRFCLWCSVACVQKHTNAHKQRILERNSGGTFSCFYGVFHSVVLLYARVHNVVFIVAKIF